jgi:hypothetical protein
VIALVSSDQLGSAEKALQRLRRELGTPPGEPGLSPSAYPDTDKGALPRSDTETAGTTRLRARTRRPSVVSGLKASIFAILVISLLIASAYANPLLSHPAAGGNQVAFGYNGPNAQDQALHSVLALIPPGASVLTTSHIFPEVSDRPDAFVVNNATGLPGNETVGGDINSWLNQSRFLAIDYWVDPANAVIFRGLANLTGFGLYAAEDGAYLYQRGWTGLPSAWAPWASIWAGSQLTSHNGSNSELYASSEGPSYYHSAGGIVGGSLWAGPRLLYLPPGNYSVTFDLELQDPTVGPHLKVQVVETPAYFDQSTLFTYSGYSYHMVTIHPEPVAAQPVVSAKVPNVAMPSLTGMNLTLAFDWTTAGYVSFPGVELSTTMSVYLTSISVRENYPLA